MDWFDAVQRSAQIAEYGDEKDEHKLQFRYEEKIIYHTNDDADGSRDPTAEYTDKLKKYGE